MKSRKLLPLVAILIIASLVLAACPSPEPEVREVVVKETVVVTEEVVVKETVVVKEEVVVEQVVEVVATPEPMAEVDRNGAWLDTVVVVEEPSADAAVSRLEVGDIDVYAFTVSNRRGCSQGGRVRAAELALLGLLQRAELQPGGPGLGEHRQAQPLCRCRPCARL
jgi:hypothetical protein